MKLTKDYLKSLIHNDEAVKINLFYGKPDSRGEATISIKMLESLKEGEETPNTH